MRQHPFLLGCHVFLPRARVQVSVYRSHQTRYSTQLLLLSAETRFDDFVKHLTTIPATLGHGRCYLSCSSAHVDRDCYTGSEVRVMSLNTYFLVVRIFCLRGVGCCWKAEVETCERTVLQTLLRHTGLTRSDTQHCNTRRSMVVLPRHDEARICSQSKGRLLLCR